MTKTRYSKQRELIYQNVKSRCDHPTAEDIYTSLKTEHPGLSLGTVYRNLNFLADSKLIRKVEVSQQVVHFDAELHPHYHFVCSSCNRVYDIDADIDDIISNAIESKTEHQIQGITVSFQGVCSNCQNKKN